MFLTYITPKSSIPCLPFYIHILFFSKNVTQYACMSVQNNKRKKERER